MTVTVHHGDCREVLATLAEASVDSVVCDPPYHLTSIHKRFAKTAGADRQPGTEAYGRLTRGFMGKTWDGGDVSFQPETWAAVLRVMKPGAHLVAFGGTRGFHRMFCAIEDAGFEVRDDFLDLFAGAPAFAAFFDSLTTAQRHAFEEMASLHSFLGALAWAYGSGFPKSHNIGNGWGTALKPAWEPICLARKPFKGTVAANVAAHGTGALNIDACRIGTSKDVPASAAKDRVGQVAKGDERGRTTETSGFDPSVGRWPANVVHDGSEEVLEAFAVYGESKTPNTVTRGSSDSKHGSSNRSGQIQSFPCHGDSGSAARFFKSTPATVEDIAWMTEPVNFASRFHYSSKADASDRLGSKHPTIKPVDLMRWLVRLVTPPGGLVLDPFAGSGTTGMAAAMEGMRAVLIEREAEYVADIHKRLGHMRGADAPLFTEVA